jgi:hypothetical protein
VVCGIGTAQLIHVGGEMAILVDDHPAASRQRGESIA